MSKECKCCGNCCWNLYECSDGYGTCLHEYPFHVTKCDDVCTNGKYVSNEEKRHYLAVLLQYNRWILDEGTPFIRKKPNYSEITKAIDFAVQYIKQIEKI